MNLAASNECQRLREFKEFLRELVGGGDVTGNGLPSGGGGGGGGGVGGGAEMRNPMTRHSNETYPVTPAELHAEIKMAVWAHLQAKRCPRHFQVPLLRAAVAHVELECRNAKGCEIACATGGDHLDDSTQYDLLKLQKFIVNTLEQMLTRLTDNSEVGNLKDYAEAGALCAEGGKCTCTTTTTTTARAGAARAGAGAGTAGMQYATGAHKNKPRKMEDRLVCLERYSDMYELPAPYSLYGVFDGHSGALAASYAVNQLPHLLAERLKLKVNSKGTEEDDDDMAYREAFEAAFLQADAMFVRKRITSGTTAVCALLAHQPPMPPHLYVAWVGDSKALLVSATTRLQLVKAHKPDALDERKRIESSDAGDGGGGGGCGGGGAVMFVQGHWRVNGVLNVSRSIGDYSVGAAIAEPDFVDVPLTKAHDFLVLGTDGLWDHVDEGAIVECVYTALAEPERRLDDIPKTLIELAKQGDSQDNITVVLVLLKERSQIVANYRTT